jgi:hypothetical protein
MGWILQRNVAITIAALTVVLTIGFSKIVMNPLLGTNISLLHLIGVGNALIAFWLWKQYI